FAGSRIEALSESGPEAPVLADRLGSGREGVRPRRLAARDVQDGTVVTSMAPGVTSFGHPVTHGLLFGSCGSEGWREPPFRDSISRAQMTSDEFETWFEKGVTDGLPVVPPTRERVQLMLAGTRRSRDMLIGEMPPNYGRLRSEEHTSELQSRSDLVCRLLLEEKKTRSGCGSRGAMSGSASSALQSAASFPRPSYGSGSTRRQPK